MYNKRYRTSKGSSLKKRTYAQYKSAKKGNDSLSFIINSNEVFSANYDPPTQGGTAAINIWEVLCRNSNFTNLKNMYDQVRIDGVRVRLSVTDAQTSVNEIGKIKNSTVICAWDKTGLSPNQVVLFDENNSEILYSDYDIKAVHSWKTKIGSGIVNATTQKKSTLNSFQRWNCFMSIYPTLNQEKSQYINTADIRDFNKRTNYNTNKTDLTDSYNAQCFNDICAISNPVVPFESSVVKFKPVLLVSVFSNEMNMQTGLVTQYGSMSNVIFNGEFSISVTFKNLKPSRDNSITTSLDDEDIDYYGELDSNIPLNSVIQRSSVEVNNSNQVLQLLNIGYTDRSGLSKVLYQLNLNDVRILKEISYPAMSDVDHVDRQITSNGRKIVDFLQVAGMGVEKFIFDVNVPISQTVSITQINGYSITSNGNNQIIPIPNGYQAVDAVSVNVNVPVPSIGQISNYSLTSNGTGINIPLPANKDAVDSITVDVDVPIEIPNIQVMKPITIVTNGLTYVDPSPGYDGIHTVAVTTAVPVPSIGQISNYSLTSNGTGISIPLPANKDAVDSITVDVNVPGQVNVYPKVTNIKLQGSNYSQNESIVSQNWYHAEFPFNIKLEPGETLVRLKYGDNNSKLDVFVHTFKENGSENYGYNVFVNEGDYFYKPNMVESTNSIVLFDSVSNKNIITAKLINTLKYYNNDVNEYCYYCNIGVDYLSIDYILPTQLTSTNVRANPYE